MSTKRTKQIPKTLPNTSVELLRNKSVVEDLIFSNNIHPSWSSKLFTLDVIDEFVAQATNVSHTYFANKVILNREGLLVFIKTQLPQGFYDRFVSKSKYGSDYLDGLLLDNTFSIIFDKSYGTCSGQIGQGYASDAFENMRDHLDMFDIAVILEVNTQTTAGVTLLDKYDPLTEYKKTLKSGEEVDITKYHQFLDRPDVQERIKNETYDSEGESDFEESLGEDNDGGKEYRNPFHIIHSVKNLLDKILGTQKIVAFIISELGECKLPSPKYPVQDVWSVNLICGGSGGNGAYLISLFLFSVIAGAQGGKWPPIGVLELAGGYENIVGLCLYTKFGFKVDSSIRSSVCFQDYLNLPHIADFRLLDLDATKQTMIGLTTSKTPIAPFYKHPICYVKNLDLQTALAVILNIRDSFYNGVYSYLAYDREYYDKFEIALYELLGKTIPKTYTGNDVERDLDEIISVLFAMSGINPLNIENTYTNSIVSLSRNDELKIWAIIYPPTPPTTPPPCNNLNNSGCTVSGGRKKNRKGRKTTHRRTKKYVKRRKTNKKRK
jgi:hypothetical protein